MSCRAFGMSTAFPVAGLTFSAVAAVTIRWMIGHFFLLMFRHEVEQRIDPRDQRQGGEFPAEVARLVDVVGDDRSVDGGDLAALVVFGGVHHFVKRPDRIGDWFWRWSRL
jgi:hypothetical protein